MNIEEKIELIQEGTLEIIDVDELKEKKSLKKSILLLILDMNLLEKFI